MNETVDPLVQTLTGRLPLLLLAAFVLTWPVSVALLALYKRSVRKSMRTRVHGEPPSSAAPPTGTSPAVSESTGAPQLLLHEQSSVPTGARNVEPHEFLDFISGKLARRFINGPEALDRRITELDTERDRDLRFRVNDFFCYDDTWRMVLSRLVRESDAVLMDLRGFSRQNSGCIFEIHELVALVPPERVVFIINESTDQSLLSQT